MKQPKIPPATPEQIASVMEKIKPLISASDYNIFVQAAQTYLSIRSKLLEQPKITTAQFKQWLTGILTKEDNTAQKSADIAVAQSEFEDQKLPKNDTDSAVDRNQLDVPKTVATPELGAPKAVATATKSKTKSKKKHRHKKP